MKSVFVNHYKSISFLSRSNHLSWFDLSFWPHSLPSFSSGPGAVGRCREFLAVSDGGQAVFRPESCSVSLMPHYIHLGQQRQGPRWPHLGGHGIGLGGSNSTLILFLLLFPSNNTHTQTHARTHAHLHWRRASLSACSTLLSPSLPSSLPSPFDLLFCLCSHSDPQPQPQPSPLLPRTVVSRLPLGF